MVKCAAVVHAQQELSICEDVVKTRKRRSKSQNITFRGPADGLPTEPEGDAVKRFVGSPR